jgi:uncharacterized cupin superfamily protein
MILRRATVPTDTRSSPGWGTVLTQRLADAGGLTQFGVALQVLQPGAKASVRHWHPHVDEFLLVVEGEATVTEDGGAQVLRAGDAACWPAGVADGHTVANRSSAPCTLLVVGSRSADGTAVYVDDADVPPPDEGPTDGTRAAPTGAFDSGAGGSSSGATGRAPGGSRGASGGAGRPPGTAR